MKYDSKGYEIHLNIKELELTDDIHSKVEEKPIILWKLTYTFLPKYEYNFCHNSNNNYIRLVSRIKLVVTALTLLINLW